MIASKFPILVLAACMVVVGISPYAIAVALDETSCTDDGISKECMVTRYRTASFELCYDNGLCGNVGTENFVHPESTWPTHWTDGTPMPDGVWMGPTLESLAEVCIDCNVSVGPREIPGLALASVSTGGRSPAATATWLPILQYAVALNATDVMNGVSQFYWRSPLKWDIGLYTQHALVIRENATGRVVSSNWYPNPVNGNNYVAMVDGDRLYYRLSAHLAGSVDYQVTEYVVTAGSPAAFINKPKVYLAIQADVGEDDHVPWRVFPGSASERVVLEEVAWSARFIAGTGTGGVLHAFRTVGSNLTHMQFVVDGRVPQNSTENPEYLRFVMPVKTSYPLNISITVTASDQISYTRPGYGGISLTNVTSTVIEDIRLDSVNFSSDGVGRTYEFIIEFLNPQATHGLSADPANNVFAVGAYTEFDAGGNQTAFSVRTTRGGEFWYDSVEWAPWIELHEVDLNPGSSTDPLAPQPQGATSVATDESSAMRGKLLGALTIIGAVVLAAGFIIAAPVTVPLGVVAAVAGGTLVTGLVVGHAHIRAAETGETFIATLGDMASSIGDAIALAACGGAFIAPGIGAKLALASTCALVGSAAHGGLPTLFELLMSIPERIFEVSKVFWTVLTDALRAVMKFVNLLLQFSDLFIGIAIASTGIFLARELLLYLMSIYRPISVAANKWSPSANVAFHRIDMLIASMPAPVWDTIQYRWSKELRGRRVWATRGGEKGMSKGA